MMTNIQAVDPGASPTSVEPILNRADPVEQGAALVDKIHDKGAVVYLIAPAIMALEQALAKGHAPKAALERWKTAIGALLPMQRRARDRVCLVSEAAMRADPAAANAAIAAHLGSAPQGPLPEDVSGEAVVPTLALIAAFALAADPEAMHLDDELEAATLTWPGMDHPTRSRDTGDLFDRYRREAAETIRPTELHQLRLEMAAQREELHAFETQLEGEALLQARNQEIEQSREQLAQALMAAEARFAEAEAELQRVREAHDGVVGWVAHMEASRSWRITAPLRAINRLRG